MTRRPPACGTESGYQRHHYLKEKADPACLAAHAAAVRASNARRPLYAVQQVEARASTWRRASVRLGEAHAERLAELRAELAPRLDAYWKTLRPARAALARERRREFEALYAEELAAGGTT